MSDNHKARSRRSLPKAMFTALRPKQWIKNLLVFAVPVAAGTIAEISTLLITIQVFIAFCLVASSLYLMNDLLDMDHDRLHPIKKNRSIAAREVTSQQAIQFAVTLAIVGLILAALINWEFFAILVVYIALTSAYSLKLKHTPVFEIAIVASGFLLRAIAGAVAVDLLISQWFMIVAGFGSFFIAAGKRYSELNRTSERGVRRKVLENYSDSYLKFVLAVTGAVTMLGYSLWAYEVASYRSVNAWAINWSIVPFILIIFRLALDIDRGKAETPEDLATKDYALIGLAVIWLVLFGVGTTDYWIN